MAGTVPEAIQTEVMAPISMNILSTTKAFLLPSYDMESMSLAENPLFSDMTEKMRKLSMRGIPTNMLLLTE